VVLEIQQYAEQIYSVQCSPTKLPHQSLDMIRTCVDLQL